VDAAKRIVNSGKESVIDIDLSKFFDGINHDRLIYLLSGIPAIFFPCLMNMIAHKANAMNPMLVSLHSLLQKKTKENSISIRIENILTAMTPPF